MEKEQVRYYDKIRQFLKTNGWMEEIPYATYTKERFELVFDTSNYVEIYQGRKRVCEGRVTSIEDLSHIIVANNIG